MTTTFSQGHFISGGRTWERAYFTTYALSLTFFESYLLPQLRSADCERVTIFVDADGYRASLMEMKSRAVGQEYSLIPVRSASGVFHPKITYLWGPEGDMLLVGSGNLTFGGHGRNIEVLEALNPTDDATAFVDFAEFLDELLASESLSIADTSALTELSQRARGQPNPQEAQSSTRLLHSLTTPVLDRLVDLAGPFSPWRELLCLSPYHHPNGKPVRALAERLGVKELRIGVPPARNSLSAFPFEESRAWGINVHAVAPRVESPSRGLHAKWFELRGRECWTLTGSVNATEQSLATTKNVELSVLRAIKGDPLDSWQVVEEPKHEPSDFSAIGSDQGLVLYAVLDADGSIRGQILGGEDLEGTWQARLRVGEDHGPEHNISVDPGGRFNWRSSEFNEFEASSSAQITMMKGARTARGWLSVQAILKLPSRSRAGQAALARMLARDEALDDCRVLLDFIAFHSNRLLRHPGKISRTRAKEVPAEWADQTFSVDDLSLVDRAEPAALLRDLAEESGNENRSWKTLSLIARLLAGRSIRSLVGSHDAGTKLTPSNQEEDDLVDELRSTTQALDSFNDQLYHEFGKAKAEDRNLVPLLVVWLNVNLDMRLRHLGDTAGAFTFVDQWVRRAINAPIPADFRRALEESVFGACAALALRTQDLRTSDSVAVEGGLSLQLVHQWLESYVGGNVDSNYAIAKAGAWFETATPNLLLDGRPEGALRALEAALGIPTPRKYLRRILEAFSRRETLALPPQIFGKDETRLLEELLKAHPNRPRHREIAIDRPGCPQCYVQLHRSIRTALQYRRVAQCAHCKTILLVLGA